MSERFNISTIPLRGLTLIERKPRVDSRGYLERMFCADEFQSVLAGRSICQINHTVTINRGAVRGLHFQCPPQAETKIVSCLDGEIFDVAVDVRRDSPTFLQWHAEVLSGENHRSLLVPEGFAHGFQALTDGCEVLYLTTAPYDQAAESALNATDPGLGIRWPLAISERSPRDEAHPFIAPDFSGVVL